VGELIAILSGKGGTGKTSVCAGIAEALAQSGFQVLCIDCDVGLRNLDIALGISELGAVSFLDVCSGAYPLEAATVHPVYPNLKFLTAPVNQCADAIDRLEFAEMLEQARKQFHYIFMDAPAGVEAGFRLAALSADRVLLVTGPDPAAIRDARQAADRLELLGKTNVRLVVNRITKKMAAAMALTVDDIMDEAGLPLLGIVPEDPNVVLAAAFRQPLLGYTTKGAAAACKRIAKRLQGIRVPILKAIKK
jgi:septum site-determining protein MinD